MMHFIVSLTACIQQGRIVPGAYKFNALVTTYEVILGVYPLQVQLVTL